MFFLLLLTYLVLCHIGTVTEGDRHEMDFAILFRIVLSLIMVHFDNGCKCKNC